jgi:phospholipase/carboxylesterase
MTSLSRRRFVQVTCGGFAAVSTHAACDVALTSNSWAGDGRLASRPRSGTKTTVDGTSPLGLDLSRDAYLRVPPNPSGRELALIVLLHGAGGSGDRFIKRLGAAIDDIGAAVLVPTSRSGTWDAIRGGFGPDVAFLDLALDAVFRRMAVDPARISVGGFSDGASYALSLGVINGDLFSRVVAFSPGFIVPGAPKGQPEIFISHGTSDPILPIDQCSRRIVPVLKQRGYPVTFREFDGGHEMPPAIAQEGLRWAQAQPAGA